MNDSKRTIKEMALLCANFKELNSLINQKLSQEKVELLKYYLLPKEWLDDYKEKNDYKNIVSHINFYMMKDYQTFKALLEDENSFNSNFRNIKIKQFKGTINQPSQNEALNISNSIYQNISCPKNFMPIKEEIIKEYTSFNFEFSNNILFLYNILLGEGNLFIFDNKNKLNIFICIYDNKNEIYTPISLLSFEDETGINEMIRCICDKHGINNYYNEKNIYINNTKEQSIFNNENIKIGSYINLSNFKSGNNNLFKESKFEFMNSIIPKESIGINLQESNQFNISNNQSIASNRLEDNEANKIEIGNKDNNQNLEKIIDSKNYEIKVEKLNNENNINNNPNRSNNLVEKINRGINEVYEDNFSKNSSKNNFNIQSKGNLNSFQRKNYIHSFSGGLYQFRNNHNNNFENNIFISNLEDDNIQNFDGYGQNMNINNNTFSNNLIINNNIINPNQNVNNLNIDNNQNNININYQNNQFNNYGNNFNNYQQNNNYYNNENNNNFNQNMNMINNYGINYNNNNQNMNNVFYNNNNLNMNNNICMNSNQNTYNQEYSNNLHISYFDDNAEENINNSNEIILTLISNQLKKESKRKVKINEKLIKIIELFSDENWIKQYPLKHIRFNGNKLDLNKSLEEQGIFKDIQLNIVFIIQ